MDTQLVDEVFIEKEQAEYDYKKSLMAFLNGDANTPLEKSYQKVKSILEEDRWVIMEDDLVYDSNINACWLGLCTYSFKYKQFNVGVDKALALGFIKNNYKLKYTFDLPTKEEIENSLTKLTSAPFSLTNERPLSFYSLLYQENNKLLSCDLDNNSEKDNLSFYKKFNSNLLCPLLRITKNNNLILSSHEVFFRWMVLGLIPKALAEDKEYNFFIKKFTKFTWNIQNDFNILDMKLEEALEDEFIYNLLHEDKIRFDIKPYSKKILEDIEQGHWSLWHKKEDFKNPMHVNLKHKLVARDPKSSIIDGTVGIDFGTKSTVVVYQKESTHIYPMRIGTGELSQRISSSDYENPTIMEFNDLEQFMKDYDTREGRPYTKWRDLTVSHTAYNALMKSSSSDFNAFVSELKQWAGNKNKKLFMIDKKGSVLEFPPFMELSEEMINPIEIYAYYIGLYINNQHNGIYLNYILSFPVTYEIEIRDRIIKSFYSGIKKSLPQELHNQSDILEKLSIVKGASEPSAYAIVALQEYDFDPEENEIIFYAVFDFGGGTTDFDFGLYREANEHKEKRYDFVIEHFGAGGDRYLGGENLLELLSFEIFKENAELLLKEHIQFILPPECLEFLGSETLISSSKEAKINSKKMMELLRPFWEGRDEDLKSFENEEINIHLIASTGIEKFIKLFLNVDKIKNILYLRITKGIKNFFTNLKLAFNHQKIDFESVETINIFLAGNSSKSKLVKDIFEKEILNHTDQEKLFKIFPPLGNSDDDMTKPTGKTGVAFGLIESREGGDTLIIDHNVKNEIKFKYYLGISKRKKFKTIITRENIYNQWIQFTDASQKTFELYYSSLSMMTTNKISIDDKSIKKMRLTLETTNEEAFIYIRLLTPTEFEYVVALEEEIEKEAYLSEIQKVTLKE